MGFKEVADLSADTTISLGGTNKKTGKANPKSIEGYFLGSKQVADKKKKSGKSFIYIFQTAKGNVGVWGKTDLDQKMGAVTPGTMVRATYDRMVPTPNGDMYKYKVEVDTENTIDVGLVAGANNSNESEGIETTDDEGTAGGYEASLDDEDEEEQDEDALQAAALANLERKKRMDAALNKGKNAKN
jgi:hypothetical protein